MAIPANIVDSVQKGERKHSESDLSRLVDTDSLFGKMMLSRLSNQAMPVDIKETNRAFILYAEVPGARKEDVEVQVQLGRVLRLQAVKKEEEQKKESSDFYLLTERNREKTVTRKFRLPDNVDIGKISAVCDNGLLVVSVPKKVQKDEEKLRVVPVKGATGLFGQSRL